MQPRNDAKETTSRPRQRQSSRALNQPPRRHLSVNQGINSHQSKSRAPQRSRCRASVKRKYSDSGLDTWQISVRHHSGASCVAVIDNRECSSKPVCIEPCLAISPSAVAWHRANSAVKLGEAERLKSKQGRELAQKAWRIHEARAVAAAVESEHEANEHESLGGLFFA